MSSVSGLSHGTTAYAAVYLLSPLAAMVTGCGNEPAAGLPYCLGHARMAYRRAGARSQGA